MFYVLVFNILRNIVLYFAQYSTYILRNIVPRVLYVLCLCV